MGVGGGHRVVPTTMMTCTLAFCLSLLLVLQYGAHAEAEEKIILSRGAGEARVEEVREEGGEGGGVVGTRHEFLHGVDVTGENRTLDSASTFASRDENDSAASSRSSPAFNVHALEGSTRVSDQLAHILGVELNDHVAALGAMSDSSTFLERSFLRPAWQRAAAQLGAWMEEAGLRVWMDEVGNVHGRSPPDAGGEGEPVVMLGSHFDTVKDGGKYDGALGVLTGIAAAKAILYVAKEKGAKLRRPVEVVGFSDEEGMRFFSHFLGSRAMTGDLVASGDLHLLTDRDGLTLAEAMTAAGLDGREEVVAKAKVEPDSIHSFVEVHIEQGPVLESMSKRLGVVSTILGATGFVVSLTGEQGHAGTVPMHLRKDALAAAAEAMGEIERRCQYPSSSSSSSSSSSQKNKDQMLVCTVGKFDLTPSVSNVIVGEASFTVDVRALSTELVVEVVEYIKDVIIRLCDRRGIACTFSREKPLKAPTQMDQKIRNDLVEAAEEASVVAMAVWDVEDEEEEVEEKVVEMKEEGKGRDEEEEEEEKEESTSCSSSSSSSSSKNVPVLPSGAGHDAMMMAKITRVAMLWVRCRGGVSHSPLEFASERDIAEGALAAYIFLRNELLLHDSQ